MNLRSFSLYLDYSHLPYHLQYLRIPLTVEFLGSRRHIFTSSIKSKIRACLHGGRGAQVREVVRGMSPHLSCKRDQIKVRDYMDRRNTPPKAVTTPALGPPLHVNGPLGSNFASWLCINGKEMYKLSVMHVQSCCFAS